MYKRGLLRLKILHLIPGCDLFLVAIALDCEVEYGNGLAK